MVGFRLRRSSCCVLFAVPADLDVKMKAVLLGAVFLIVSFRSSLLKAQIENSVPGRLKFSKIHEF